MGLLTRILLLPLAPAEGVSWLARQLGERAYEELYGPDAIRSQLADLEAALLAGEISEEEFAAEEDALLDQLDAAMNVEGSS